MEDDKDIDKMSEKELGEYVSETMGGLKNALTDVVSILQKINIEKAYFNIGNSEYYEGYHIKNKRWNGFATPSFEKHIADLIAHNFSTSDFKINYDKNKDCYCVNVYEDGKIIENYQFEKQTINTTDGKKDVYSLGAYYWTWDDYTLDEIKDNPNIHIIRNKNIEKDDSINLEY